MIHKTYYQPIDSVVEERLVRAGIFRLLFDPTAIYGDEDGECVDPELPPTAVIDIESVGNGTYAVWLNDKSHHEVKVFGEVTAICVTHAPTFCVAAARTCMELASRKRRIES